MVGRPRLGVSTVQSVRDPSPLCLQAPRRVVTPVGVCTPHYSHPCTYARDDPSPLCLQAPRRAWVVTPKP